MVAQTQNLKKMKYLICYSHEWLGEKWVTVAHIYSSNVVGESYSCGPGEYFQDDKEVGQVDILHDHTA